MIAMLVECTDYDYIYGILNVEAVDEEKVQQKIYEIKNKFYEEGFDDWSIKESDLLKLVNKIVLHIGNDGIVMADSTNLNVDANDYLIY